MTLYDKYLSSFSGQVIDDCISWVKNVLDKGVDILGISEEFNALSEKVNSQIGSILGKLRDVSKQVENNTKHIKEHEDEIETLKESINGIDLRITSDKGVRIDVLVGESVVCSKKIPPMSFNGEMEVGKWRTCGVVDRDFVNSLKDYVKKAVDGELPKEEGEDEPFRPRWKEVVSDLSITKNLFTEKMEAQQTELNGLKIYGDLMKER